jgi:hypothetical protein
MVIVQALLAMVFRSAGKLLNTVFGWATVMLFGRVPQDRQIYLSVVTFGSVIWLLALVGVAFPTVGTFLLSFVPLPEWVDRKWVRLAMLAAALVVPAIVGVISLRLVDPEDRPSTVRAVLRGYPYTIGLALTLILMTLFAPVLKVRDLARRWTTQHVPVMIEPKDYPSVVDDVEDALRRGGLDPKRGTPSWMLRVPTRLLSWFAGSAVSDLVADELTVLHSEKGQVLLHPSDMVISGREFDAARLRAIIAERLTFTRAHLTWTAEANEVEDSLRRIWESSQGGAGTSALARLATIESRMRSMALPYEEWEVLFRQKLHVERSVLRQLAGVADDAPTAGRVSVRPMGALEQAMEAVAEAVTEFRRSWKAEARGRGVGLMPFLAAFATVGLVLSRDRRPPRPGRGEQPVPDAHAEARFSKAA